MSDQERAFQQDCDYWGLTPSQRWDHRVRVNHARARWSGRIEPFVDTLVHVLIRTAAIVAIFYLASRWLGS